MAQGGDATQAARHIDGVLGPAGGRLDRALAEAVAALGDAPPLSRSRLQALIAEGQVRVSGAIATQPAAAAPPGAAFSIGLPPPAPVAAPPQAMPLAIVYEDADLIVIDKPAGLVVHPAVGNREGTLVNALLHHCHGQLSGVGGLARPGIVHRIDKDTSGLIVAAKSDAAHLGLARQFAAHTIARRYLAVAAGWPAPTAGTIRGVIGRSPTNRKKMAVLPEGAARGKAAVTHYRTLARLGAGGYQASEIECRLETGRTHQIRVHLSSIGHGLIGDAMYGGAGRWGIGRQALHAAELGFIHPINGKPLHFVSPMPADMATLVERIGRAPG